MSISSDFLFICADCKTRQRGSEYARLAVLQEAHERAGQLFLSELSHNRLYGVYRQRARRPQGHRDSDAATPTAAGCTGNDG